MKMKKILTLIAVISIAAVVVEAKGFGPSDRTINKNRKAQCEQVQDENGNGECSQQGTQKKQQQQQQQQQRKKARNHDQACNK